MANIYKRANGTFQITVSCGYDTSGKQIRRRKTYKPAPNMTAKQIDKEVKRQAVLFEEQCANGLSLNGNVRFQDFAETWMQHKKQSLQPKTWERYDSMLPRIFAAIGHMRLDRIQPQHLLTFYENLSEGKIRQDTKYACQVNLKQYIAEQKTSKAAFARLCGVAPSTISTVIQNEGHCSESTAEKLCKGLGMKMSEAFKPINANKPLASKTVLHHHRLISSMLHTAVKWGMLASNPCDRTDAPRVERTEPRYLDETQAATLLDLLENERLDKKTMVRFLLFTGLRRGELLGLKWEDVDFEKGVLRVARSTQYLAKRGIIKGETKTDASYRYLKLSKTALNDLRSYRVYQLEQKLRLGDQWQDSGFLFTNAFGAPLHPDTLTQWLSKFVKKHSDVLPNICVHSLRHTNATLQIASGIPITTVAKRMGHADSSVTGRIYAHAIQSADAAAAEALDDILQPNKNRTA